MIEGSVVDAEVVKKEVIDEEDAEEIIEDTESSVTEEFKKDTTVKDALKDIVELKRRRIHMGFWKGNIGIGALGVSYLLYNAGMKYWAIIPFGIFLVVVYT